MRKRQTPKSRTIPHLWLISDARNDAVLDIALQRLPRGSGFVFRHYHLAPADRRARFRTLSRIARQRGHIVLLADTPALARQWGAQGTYGPPGARPSSPTLLRINTAHTLRELGRCQRHGADAIILSPVFATRSHPGGKTLGPLRFRLLATRARAPVIPLGGMTRRNAARLGWPRWAAIDGLS